MTLSTFHLRPNGPHVPMDRIPRLVQNIALDAMLVAMNAGLKTIDAQSVGHAIIDMEAD